jgi:hypothetical protein
MRNLKQFIFCSVIAVIYGCSDSPSQNNIIVPVFVTPLENFNISDNTLYEIDVSDGLKSIPVIANLAQALLIDVSELEGQVVNEDFPNDRSVTPEYMIYTKQASPDLLYVYNFKTRKELEVLDLSDSSLATEPSQICQIVASRFPDQTALKAQRLEIKQELKVYLVSSETSCDDSQSLQYFVVKIFEDQNATYSVREPVLTTITTDEGPEEKLEVRTVSYPLLFAERQTVYLSETSQQTILIDGPNQNYGHLGFDLENNNIDFYVRRTTQSSDLYRLWSHSFQYALDSNGEPVAPKLFFASDLDNSPAYMLNGRELLKLSRNNMFNLVDQIERISNFENPIYTWSSNSPYEGRILQTYGATEKAFIDDQKVVILNTSDQATVVKNYENEPIGREKRLDLRVPEDRLNIIKIFDTEETLVNLTIGGVESTIQAGSSAIFTYGNRPQYDFISGSQRFAQSDSGGGPDYVPSALENTAWMPLKNYLEDRQELYILQAESSPEGVLTSPKIYAYDRLEPNDQGAEFASIPGDVAEVLEAAVISQTLGMIWAKRSFLADASVDAYYFDPSTEKPYQLTLIDENAQLPDWLPFVEEE